MVIANNKYVELFPNIIVFGLKTQTR
ncbi:hypothetical protein [Mycoplasmopsis bovis]